MIASQRGISSRLCSWSYVWVALATTVFAAEVRRIFDWKVGFSAISLLSIMPLIVMVPAILVLSKLMRGADRSLVLGVYLWLGAFGYGYVLALANGNAFAGTYSLAGFILPMAFGTLIAYTRTPVTEQYERLAKISLVLGTIAAVYAIFQFAAPPPWDVAWMKSAKVNSIGSPVAFKFRAFGPLNAPGPLADFLCVVLLLNFPRLSFAHKWRLVPFGLISIAFLLTLVRSSWIAAVIGIVVFIALSPNRTKNLSILAVATFSVVILAANASTLFGSAQAGNDLTSRFASFSDLSDDVSFNDRQKYFGQILNDAVTQPIGQGLGLLGTAAKLGDAGQTIAFDNGYLARFTELGYFGFACYLAAIALALVVTVRKYRRMKKLGQLEEARVAAVFIAIQVALIFLDTASDKHTGLTGVFFWASFAIIAQSGIPTLIGSAYQKTARSLQGA